MSRITLELDVLMFDNINPHHVVCDQRDYAKWEVQPFDDQLHMHTKARFLAWSALTRQGIYSKPFQTFNEIECIEANAADDPDDTEDEQSLDPGRTPPPAGRPSTSPAKPANRSRKS